MAVLTVRKLTMRFGGITAVNAVDLVVEKGQIYSVIGPNGAGKTTVFNAVTGIYEPSEGAIRFEGRELRRPLRWWVWLWCAAIGLASGLMLLLAAADVNQLWHAAIERTKDNAAAGFSTAA